jgi:hypothetical protein
MKDPIFKIGDIVVIDSRVIDFFIIFKIVSIQIGGLIYYNDEYEENNPRRPIRRATEEEIKKYLK